MSEYRQGYYHPINVEKYVGKKVPFCRSSWEFAVCDFFDHADFVFEWASEPFAIQYEWINESGHTSWKPYVPDFYVKMQTNNGIKKFIVEVKPKRQVISPKEPKKKTPKAMKRYLGEQVLYRKNQSKWFYAKKFCEKHGFEFKIITEDELPNKYKKKPRRRII